MDSNRVTYVDISGFSQDATSVVTVQLRADGTTLQGTPRRSLMRVIGMTVDITSTSATTFKPFLLQSSAGAGTFEERFREASAQAVADIYNKDFGADALLLLTDTTGAIYFGVGPDAGADTEFQARIFYESIRIGG